MSQNLPLASFKWIENISQFMKDFIKNSNEDSLAEYFLEVDVQYLKNYMDFMMIYRFY